MQARTFAPVALALATMGIGTATAAELAYHFTPGESFTFQVVNEADPPRYDPVVTTMNYAFTAGDGVPAPLEVDISGTSTSFDPGQATASFELDETGAASNLQSDQIDDEVTGAFVKNAPGLFPPLPGGDVQVGQQWQAEAALHLPKMDVPGAIRRLRTITRYTYQGTETWDENRVVHVLKSVTNQKPGEKAKLHLNTTSYLDMELGRIVRSDASGYLKVKVSFFWVKVPTTYDMVEVGEESEPATD